MVIERQVVELCRYYNPKYFGGCVSKELEMR